MACSFLTRYGYIRRPRRRIVSELTLVITGTFMEDASDYFVPILDEQQKF
jgi:hypothetical protein